MDKQTAEERYSEIIEEAVSRECENGVVYEKHHIKPKSLFPKLRRDRNNIIKLTCAEHILAHYYLCFIYPGKKTLHAFKMMTSNRVDIFDENSELRLELILPNISRRREKSILENYNAPPIKQENSKVRPNYKEKLRKRMSVSKSKRNADRNIKSIAELNRGKFI